VNALQHSFVGLPSYVRTRVYAELLLLDTEEHLAPSQVTKVPGLVLLRTCKQVHDEVAALFYARNAFSYYVKKIVPMQKASIDHPQHPSIRSAPDHYTLRDPFNISGGVFFPAARHHKYLTSLTTRLN
jgi:hypothetical protein